MNFDIKKYTHFLVVAGSHAYGTNTDESDIDIRGWAIPPVEIILSYANNFDQNETSQQLKYHSFNYEIQTYIDNNKIKCKTDSTDSTIYNIKKFFSLAADCNPNIIDLLFTRDTEIIRSDDYGNVVREAAPLFLSQRARYSFTGYAVSQLKRIYTHRRWLMNPIKKKPQRSDYDLPETSLIPADQRQAAQALIDKKVRLWLLEESEIDKTIIDHVQTDLLDLIGGILLTKSTEETQEKIESAAGKHYGMSEKYINILQQEKKYRSALAEFNQYNTWLENRNPVRAELEHKYMYDTKHAFHLARLLIEAEEILNKGTLTLKQPEHIEFFKAIRNGAWTFEKLLEWSSEKMAILQDKNVKCVVPKIPDVVKLDNIYRTLVIEAIEDERAILNEAKD